MPHEFTEYRSKPEPQPASSRGVRPPNKSIGVDLLDRPEAPLPDLAHRPWHWQISFWWGIALLIGSLLLLLFAGLLSSR
ncbi:MAG: hypothetical protein ABSE45_08835 [Candidatus Acidiferrales bacterium]|jgi:hypothetical protein